MRVTVRASSSTVRYASFWRTSTDRSGSISSRAVARRMVPSRCTSPVESTSPRGSVNAYSDFTVPLLDLEALVAERDAPDGDLVGVRLQAHARVLLGPRVDDRVGDHGVELVVHHRDGAVLAGFLELAVDDQLAPVPQRLVLIDAALELDVAPVGVSPRFEQVVAAVGQRPLVLGALGLGVEPRGLLEESRRFGTPDGEGEPNRDMCFLVIGRHPG